MEDEFLTKEVAQQIVNLQFDSENCKVVQISRLAGGVLNSIYKVNLQYGNDTLSVVFKIYSESNLDPNATASHEEISALHQHVFKAGAYVPENHDYINNFQGNSIKIMEYIEGALLNSINDQQAFALGQSIAQFHLASSGFPPFKVQPNDIYSLGSEVWQSLSRLYQNQAVRNESGYLATLMKYAVGTLSYPDASQLPIGLVHGDIHPGNVIQCEDKTYLLDFDLCNQGPLIKDLANAICMFCFITDSEKKIFTTENMMAMLRGYHSIRPLNQAEIDYLPAALRDRAEMEKVANTKLSCLGMPAGSPFDSDCAKALEEVLSSKNWTLINRAITKMINDPRKASSVSIASTATYTLPDSNTSSTTNAPPPILNIYPQSIDPLKPIIKPEPHHANKHKTPSTMNQ